ncbi:MAG TPA: prepilin-type N-terminal cleavage/methylation domain-containing protein [Alphaproteobacteria bacterium]|nr:prepilin-type N-terminal cleavage/methylation domain-containing protein [Alphaproteobacteria bacterium]
MSSVQHPDRPSADLPRRERGFTLIELLVAFTVASLLLAVIYEIFSTGVRATAVGRHTADALLVAQSSLDTITGVAVAPGKTTDMVGPFERTTDVRMRPDLLPRSAQISVMPYEIVVRVAWRDGVQARDVSLSTLWLGPPLASLKTQSEP